MEQEIIGMQELKIKFGGQTHQIEANTFLNTLLHFVSLVQEANRQLDNSKKIEIKINAQPKPGSFVLDLMFVSSTILGDIKNLFSKDNLEYVGELITVVSGVFGLAKFLGGKKPKTIETVNNSIKVKNNNGEIIYINNLVLNVFNNKSVQSALANAFETLDADDNVTSFGLSGKDKDPIIEIPKDDFNKIANPDNVELLPNEKIASVNAVLNIISLDWELKRKWDFYYLGNKITAKIKDDVFGDLIKKGEPFRMGDSLEVEMEIKQQYDESADTFVNKTYIVTRIIKHIPRSDQSSINFS